MTEFGNPVEWVYLDWTTPTRTRDALVQLQKMFTDFHYEDVRWQELSTTIDLWWGEHSFTVGHGSLLVITRPVMLTVFNPGKPPTGMVYIDENKRPRPVYDIERRL